MANDSSTEKIPFSQKVKDAIPTAILLVGLAYLLSLVMSAPFAFTASFLSSTKPSDFDFADFYNVVADGRPVREIDSTVVVLNLDNSDRAEFAAAFDMLHNAGPAAVGVDVLFQEPHDPSTDAWLISALRGMPNVVMAESLLKNDGKNLFHVTDRSFFADTIGEEIEFAASNLPARITAGTVRTFRPDYPTVDGTISGFATAVAAKANPEAAAELRRRGNEQETINYPSREITVLTPGDLADSPDAVRGKVVLIGAVSKTEDIHPTPVDNNMSGILIHAYSIATILNSSYLDRQSPWLEWSIACLLCFIITLGFCVISVNYKGLTLRITQMALLMFVIYIGYYLFVEKNKIIDFSAAMLMITFGLFACDLRLGLTSIAKALPGASASFWRKLNKKFSKTSKN